MENRELYEMIKMINDKLSIIRENSNLLDWRFISSDVKLQESFIREFADKVNWTLVSGRQKLSEDFIREFKDKLD